MIAADYSTLKKKLFDKNTSTRFFIRFNLFHAAGNLIYGPVCLHYAVRGLNMRTAALSSATPNTHGKVLPLPDQAVFYQEQANAFPFQVAFIIVRVINIDAVIDDYRTTGKGFQNFIGDLVRAVYPGLHQIMNRLVTSE